MNSRKFCFIVSFVLMGFLFLTGTFLLNYINKSVSYESEGNTGGFFNDFFKDFVPLKDPVNILILGGDRVHKNTDTIMVANYNPTTARVSVLSIPRDTKTRINGKYRKINYAYPNGGAQMAADTIHSLLGININYYIYVDISVFRQIIDTLDGVDVYVPVDMDYDDPYQDLHIHLKKGRRHLNGKQAEQFVRFRHPNGYKYTSEMLKFYDGSDLKRIDAQQNFLKEIVRQKANIRYFSKLDNIVNLLFSNVKDKNIDTNLNSNVILKLARNMSGINPDTINTFKLLGESGSYGYYVFTDKITNTKTRETLDSETVLKNHFNSRGTFINAEERTDMNISNDSGSGKGKSSGGSGRSNRNTPTPPSFTKGNPSNNQTRITPDPTPKP